MLINIIEGFFEEADNSRAADKKCERILHQKGALGFIPTGGVF